MVREKQALSFRLKLGYGMAYVGDTAVYNMLMMYALFFLTDVALLNPAAAGTVVSVATVWNTAAVVAIGYISDRFAFKKGHRLPYMYASILPMAVLLVLMFTVIETGDTVKAVYYTVIHGALWTAHSAYLLPHEALGADIAANSAERTSLRSYARLFMGGGNLLGVVFILYIVSLFEAVGLSLPASWQAAAVIVAVVGSAALLASCLIVEKEVGCGTKKEQAPREGMLRAYWEVLKLKPLRRLLAATFFFAVANAFFSSDIVYFMKYDLELADGKKTVLFFVLALSGILFTPLFSWLTARFSKEWTMAAAFLGAGAFMAFFGLRGITSFSVICLFAVIFNVGASAYWQLYYAVVYDVCALDKCQCGHGREAVIMSLSKIVLKLSTAAAIQLFGFLLSAHGYRGDCLEQTPEALESISICLTYIPALLLAAAAAAIFFYIRGEKRRRI